MIMAVSDNHRVLVTFKKRVTTNNAGFWTEGEVDAGGGEGGGRILCLCIYLFILYL